MQAAQKKLQKLTPNVLQKLNNILKPFEVQNKIQKYLIKAVDATLWLFGSDFGLYLFFFFDYIVNTLMIALIISLTSKYHPSYFRKSYSFKEAFYLLLQPFSKEYMHAYESSYVTKILFIYHMMDASLTFFKYTIHSSALLYNLISQQF